MKAIKEKAVSFVTDNFVLLACAGLLALAFQNIAMAGWFLAGAMLSGAIRG